MKRNSKFIMLGVIALAGTTVFTACSSDESAPVNPTFDGESVKTSFTISLPGNVAKTRMSYETVQGSEAITDFRGMSDIVIVPYLDATNRDYRLGKNITLWYGTQIKPDGTTNAENSIPQGKLLENTNAVLFNDVTIPLRTSGFLFYGKATETTTDNYANGNLTVAGMGDNDESSAKTFTPTPIVASVNDAKGVALAEYVTSIAAAAAADQTTYPGATWAACAVAANHIDANQAWYNSDLGDRYTAFTSLKPGASAYVQAAVQDLYTAISNSTNPVAVAIKTAITNSTYVSSVDASGKLTFTDAISNYPSDATSALVGGTTPTGEPNNFMPDGAAFLQWDDATPKKATAVATNTNNNMTVNMTKVAYPAALWYFANSKLKTSNTSKKDEYNGTNTNWDGILGKYTDGTSVAATTQSVAIVDPIQYGVGRLDTKVNKLTDGTKYYDRQGVEVNIANGFTFTGVLIGGQKAVDYKFEPTGTEVYTIYDKAINTSTNGSAALSTSADAGTNYTLALQTAPNDPVYVALEFLNKGDDFYGYDGVVKKNCKFYMIAKLDPTVTTGGVEGKDNTEGRVFMQDHKTIATFTIAPGAADGNFDGLSDAPAGFANAYVTIPDLRTPMLELGFSVDLKWQDGITFTQTF